MDGFHVLVDGGYYRLEAKFNEGDSEQIMQKLCDQFRVPRQLTAERKAEIRGLGWIRIMVTAGGSLEREFFFNPDVFRDEKTPEEALKAAWEGFFRLQLVRVIISDFFAEVLKETGGEIIYNNWS